MIRFAEVRDALVRPRFPPVSVPGFPGFPRFPVPGFPPGFPPVSPGFPDKHARHRRRCVGDFVVVLPG
jgi:hypothetical protein